MLADPLLSTILENPARSADNYEIFITGRVWPISNLYEDIDLSTASVKQPRLAAMTVFAPQRVYSSRHFDIRADAGGRWVTSSRDGLCGGIFRTRAAAIHFALFETGGDDTHIHEGPGIPG